MLVRENQVWASVCHYSDISVTFISYEAIRNSYIKLYVNLCVDDHSAPTMVNYRNYWLHPTNLVRQRHLYYSKKATATFVSYQTSDRWVSKRATKRYQKPPWKASVKETHMMLVTFWRTLVKIFAASQHKRQRNKSLSRLIC